MTLEIFLRCIKLECLKSESVIILALFLILILSCKLYRNNLILLSITIMGRGELYVIQHLCEHHIILSSYYLSSHEVQYAVQFK